MTACILMYNVIFIKSEKEIKESLINLITELIFVKYIQTQAFDALKNFDERCSRHKHQLTQK